MLKGILDIKVYDKNGNIKQHETGENLITDYVLNKIKMYNSNLIRQLGLQTNPIFSSNIIEDFSGILLLNNNLIEDKTNYFRQILSSKVIGHADSSGTDFESSQVGVLNLVSSEVTDNSITRIWNFGQGKGTGTINSVALCTNILGRLGIKDDTFYSNPNSYHYFLNTAFNNDNFSASSLWFRVFKEGEYTATPSNDYNGTVIYPIYVKNNKIYCYLTSVQSKKRTTKIYEIDMSKYYSKKSFANDFSTKSYSSSPVIFVKDEPIIELTTDGSDSYGTDSYSFSIFNGKIYMVYAPTTSDRILVEFDVDNRTYNTKRNTMDYNNHNYNFNSFGVDNENIYIADNYSTGSIARFTKNFVYVTNIDIDEDVLGTQHTLSIKNFDESGLFIIKNDSYNSPRQCITDLYNFGLISNASVVGRSFISSPDEFKNIFSINCDNNEDEIRLYKNYNNISTIKNLTNPVIKGETDEMVVTYKIIKTEA